MRSSPKLIAQRPVRASVVIHPMFANWVLNDLPAYEYNLKRFRLGEELPPWICRKTEAEDARHPNLESVTAPAFIPLASGRKTSQRISGLSHGILLFFANTEEFPI